MTDVPIIFSAPMVLALLAGRKTMTRRLAWTARKNSLRHHPGGAVSNDPWARSPWQGVKPGDRLWVRESIKLGNHYVADGTEAFDPHGHRFGWVWQRPLLPSIYMPRAYSRITLVVTATKIERLQMIRNADILAEGIPGDPPQSVVFAGLWDQLHGPDSWSANPDVVALTFAVHQQNIDAMEAAA
jgi:hypothetical protein